MSEKFLADKVLLAINTSTQETITSAKRMLLISATTRMNRMRQALQSKEILNRLGMLEITKQILSLLRIITSDMMRKSLILLNLVENIFKREI